MIETVIIGIFIGLICSSSIKTLDCLLFCLFPSAPGPNHGRSVQKSSLSSKTMNYSQKSNLFKPSEVD